MIKLFELAEMIGAKFYGDGNIEIKRVALAHEAEENEIVFCLGERNRKYLDRFGKKVVLVSRTEIEGFSGLIIAEKNFDKNASTKIENIYSFFGINERFYDGIDDSVIIGKDVKLGKGVEIGAHCSIGDNVEIGNDTKLYPNVVIYPDVKIGKNCRIHSGVVIRVEMLL